MIKKIKLSAAPRKATYIPPATLCAWLAEEKGRAAYFQKVDPSLFAPIISKIKAGIIPVTFETAVRLERAQKPSQNPFHAEDLMTFKEHRELYRYVTGREPAPAPWRPEQDARGGLTEAA